MSTGDIDYRAHGMVWDHLRGWHVPTTGDYCDPERFVMVNGRPAFLRRNGEPRPVEAADLPDGRYVIIPGPALTEKEKAERWSPRLDIWIEDSP